MDLSIVTLLHFNMPYVMVVKICRFREHDIGAGLSTYMSIVFFKSSNPCRYLKQNDWPVSVEPLPSVMLSESQNLNFHNVRQEKVY